MANSHPKVIEGNELISKGEKCLKTSLLKWRPDFDSAASEFTKAATCFKIAKSLEKCKDAHLRAADAYMKNEAVFHAAKCYEQAAFVAKDLNDLDSASTLFDKAAHHFLENGTGDTAALVLDKGAKIVESKYPDRAIVMLQKASDICEMEDRPKESTDYLSRIAVLQIRLNRLDAAVDTITKEMILHQQAECWGAVPRLVVAIVLVHLHRDDNVSAQQVFDRALGYPGFSQSEEGHTLSQLLEGYDQSDGDKVNRALGSAFLRHMDNQYAILARTLKTPEGFSSGQNADHDGGLDLK